MVKFVDVDPNEMLINRHRYSRVSYPILKSFMETGKYCAILDRTEMQQSLQSLMNALSHYVIRHALPIKVLGHKAQIYLLRLDLDAHGNIIEGWQDKSSESSESSEGLVKEEKESPLEPPTVMVKRVEKRRYTVK